MKEPENLKPNEPPEQIVTTNNNKDVKEKEEISKDQVTDSDKESVELQKKVGGKMKICVGFWF